MYLIKYSNIKYTLVVIDSKNCDNKIYKDIDSSIALALIDRGCKVFDYIPKEK